MNASPSRRTTRFLVSWPVQGATVFRSPQSELALSDVYWRWIYEALARLDAAAGERSSFVERVEEGFEEDLEKATVDREFLERLRRVDSATAPSFEKLVAAPRYVSCPALGLGCAKGGARRIR